MTTCPHCGHKFVATGSVAAMVLGVIGPGDSNVSWIKSQMPKGIPDKEIYNAISYLARKKMVERQRAICEKDPDCVKRSGEPWGADRNAQRVEPNRALFTGISPLINSKS